MKITIKQQEQIKEIFKQLDTGMCEVIVLEDTGDFSNRMIFESPMEALDIIEEEELTLDAVDIHRRELTVTNGLGILFFIKFNDLKADETFSLV